MTKLIFGCGYLGSRVARLWREAGEDVVAVTRSESRAEQFRSDGLGAVVADLNEPEFLADLPTADTVLFAVGYDRSVPVGERRSIEEIYAGGLANVLDALSDETRRIIHISSTGVYGSADGEAVDEDSPCSPEREGGRACLVAEEVLAQHHLGSRGIVLRLAGIYGPERVPRLKELRAGKPFEVSPDGMLNLIHVDDAAQVVLAAEKRATPPRTYCVSDGNACLRRDWFREVARLASLPEPKFAEPSGQDLTSRASSSKRVLNDRMIKELGVDLKYPNYREGLKQILRVCS